MNRPNKNAQRQSGAEPSSTSGAKHSAPGYGAKRGRRIPRLDAPNMIAPMLLSADEGADFIGVSERLFHELRRKPDFPKAVVLSKRCVRYKRQELLAYIDRLTRSGYILSVICLCTQ